MSVTKSIAEQKKEKKSPKVSKQANKNYINFHPTKEQKEELKNYDKYTPEWAITVIQSFISGSATLSMGYANRTDSYFATCREKCDDWRDARTLSCFHSDPARALVGLAYALESLYDSFPNISPTVSEQDLDW